MSKVFDGIDWKLFREQKSRLIALANDDDLPTVDVELLDGLVNFLDHFMDCAAEELDGGAPLVFGTDEKSEPYVLNKESQSLVSFLFKGCVISNPYESECSRFKVDPSDYGFEPVDLGGGCKGLQLTIEAEGRFILITDQRTSVIPTPDTKAEDILIGSHSTKTRLMLAINTLAEVIAATAKFQQTGEE